MVSTAGATWHSYLSFSPHEEKTCPILAHEFFSNDEHGLAVDCGRMNHVTLYPILAHEFFKRSMHGFEFGQM